ncbi:MAG: flagellar export chaperone FliS [Terriglobia bacterium]
MTSPSPETIYQEIQVNTSTGLNLVVMLYDGALRFISQAKNAIQERQYADKAMALDRALAILGELQSTLNLEEGGEIAKSLDRLYTYMSERLLEASAKLDTRILDEVTKLLRTLNSAWTELAQRAAVRPSQPEIKPAVPQLCPDNAPGMRSSLEVFG